MDENNSVNEFENFIHHHTMDVNIQSEMLGRKFELARPLVIYTSKADLIIKPPEDNLQLFQNNGQEEEFKFQSQGIC